MTFIKKIIIYQLLLLTDKNFRTQLKHSNI